MPDDMPKLISFDIEDSIKEFEENTKKKFNLLPQNMENA